MNVAEQELLSVKDVCKMLDIGRTTLYRLKDSGRVPKPLKLGRSVKWRKDELEKWIEAGCPPVTRWEWEGGR